MDASRGSTNSFWFCIVFLVTFRVVLPQFLRIRGRSFFALGPAKRSTKGRGQAGGTDCRRNAANDDNDHRFSAIDCRSWARQSPANSANARSANPVAAPRGVRQATARTGVGEHVRRHSDGVAAADEQAAPARHRPGDLDYIGVQQKGVARLPLRGRDATAKEARSLSTCRLGQSAGA